MSQAFLHIGNTHVNVEGGLQALNVIGDAISYEVEGFEIIKRRQYAKTRNKYWLTWDGRRSFLDRRSKSFLTGLLPDVVNALRIMGIEYKLLDQRRPPAGLPVDCAGGYFLRDGKHGQIELYGFQKEVCEAVLSRKRGIAKLATGAGKTECAIRRF